MSADSNPPAVAGPATDRHNEPVNDPTENVLGLVEAAVQRLDDLRIASDYHQREMAKVLATHERELRLAESQRIDSIRSVDVTAVQQAASVAETRATALANQVAQSAEAMRNQVAATATAQATSLAAALVPLQEAIADLRRAQYEQQGQKAQVTEGRAKGGGVGLWVGIGVAAFFGLMSLAVGVATVIVLIAR